MANKKVWEYVILLHPTADEAKSGKQTEMLNGGIAHVLAVDEKAALLTAARHIPDEHMDKVDRMEVAIRPF